MVEIRELVIQARLREDASAERGGSNNTQEKEGAAEEPAAQPPDAELVQKIVERCLHEVRNWWREKHMR